MHQRRGRWGGRRERLERVADAGLPAEGREAEHDRAAVARRREPAGGATGPASGVEWQWHPPPAGGNEPGGGRDHAPVVARRIGHDAGMTPGRAKHTEAVGLGGPAGEHEPIPARP